MIDSDPTVEQAIPERRKRSRFWAARKTKILSDKEIERVFHLMIDSTTPRSLRDHAILSILLETGISIGTLVGVDVSDFDSSKYRLRVMPEGFIESYWLSIPRSTDLLLEYLREGRPNLTDSKVELGLIVSQMGGRMSRQAIWQALQNWGKLAKLKQNLSPRLVRYTAAARMLSRGLTVAEMQRLLGHRNRFSTQALLRRMNAAAVK